MKTAIKLLITSLLVIGCISVLPLDPLKIPQWVTQIDGTLPYMKPDAGSDYTQYSYTVVAKKITQQLLPPINGVSLPTTLYAYGGMTTTGQTVFSFPAPTISNYQNIKSKVTWINDINGPHILPVDISFPFLNQGFNIDVPIVPHVHGVVTNEQSDGQPTAWWTKTGKVGSYANMAAVQHPTLSNAKIYSYPNSQEPVNIWYHDHVMSITRLNVYAGLAGLWTIAPNPANPAVTAQEKNIAAHYGTLDTRILVISDKSFNDDGSLFYPSVTQYPGQFTSWVPEFFGDTFVVNGKVWPKMKVQPKKYRFIMLNACQSRFLTLFLRKDALPSGVDNQPFEIIRQGDYFNNPHAVPNTAVNPDPLDNPNTYQFTPSARIEMVVDFSKYAVGDVLYLRNDANKPYPGGNPVINGLDSHIMQFQVVALGSTPVPPPPPAPPVIPSQNTSQALNQSLTQLQKDLNTSSNNLKTTLSTTLSTNLFSRRLQTANIIQNRPILTENPVSKRFTILNEQSDAGGVLGAQIDGIGFETSFLQTALNTFNYRQTYDVYIINLTPDAHPIHFHMINFQKIAEYDFDNVGYQAAFLAQNGPLPRAGYAVHPIITDPTPFLGAQYLPGQFEQSFRDVVTAAPGRVTRIRVRFQENDGRDYPVPIHNKKFVYHCHILEHEDNDMMKYYYIQDPAIGVIV